MDKDQSNDLNEESSDECGATAENISTVWKVDKAGNVFRIGDKFGENLADLTD